VLLRDVRQPRVLVKGEGEARLPSFFGFAQVPTRGCDVASDARWREIAVILPVGARLDRLSEKDWVLDRDLVNDVPTVITEREPLISGRGGEKLDGGETR
jgi:hypothetical protein